MALTDLTPADFQFFKKKANAMRHCHEQEFVRFVDPDMMRAMYRGRINRDYRETHYVSQDEENHKHLTSYSRLFQATNTIVPMLFPQMPSPIITPGRGSDNDGAALMTAILKHYSKLNQSKRQNQEAILNTWFFGIGWKKLGYRTVFIPRVDEPETTLDQSILGKMKSAAMSMFGKPDNTESRESPELVDYETLFNDSESPMNVYLDDKTDLANGRFRLWRMPRTLYDLRNYGDYDESTLGEVEKRMKDKFGTRFDSRETELTLNEMHAIQRNGTWICTWLDEYEQPLRYEQSTYQGKGFLDSPLILTNEPGVRYPTSHLKVASQVQTKLDKLASLYVELMARSVSLLYINEKGIAPGMRKTIEENVLKGIIFGTKPLNPGDITAFTSGSVPPELGQLIQALQANITEILGSDEQLIAGRSKNETLGQDELARSGTKTREGGMRDRISDWMIDQYCKEGTLVKQYSSSELHIQITGKDYADPMTGENIEDKWISFMTEGNPLGAKHYLQGEFEYDINVEELVKPNKQVQRQQYEQILTTLPAFENMLLQDNCRVRAGLIAKEYFKTFDGIGNVDRFIEKLTPTQVAAIQTSKLMMEGMGQSVLPQPEKGEKAKGDVSQPSSQEAAT